LSTIFGYPITADVKSAAGDRSRMEMTSLFDCILTILFSDQYVHVIGCLARAVEKLGPTIFG
jgi:hypothetical protein